MSPRAIKNATNHPLSDLDAGPFQWWVMRPERGLITSMVKRFKPAGSATAVVHDDTQPCRTKGKPSCTYNVSW